MKKFIIGNWKMNLNVHEASLFVAKLAQEVPIRRNVVTVICPGFLTLQPLSLQVNHRQMKLGAQDIYWRDSGAFTGEVSATQLRGLAQYVLVGHSERRHVFGEDDREIRFKVQAALRNGIRPILCIGETEFERNAGEMIHVINDQITSGFMNVGSDEVEEVIVAYEPVWSIGTGRTPTLAEITEMAKIIRRQIERLFGKKSAAKVAILYGGSVNLTNAKAILSTAGINGILAGGASLLAPEFAGMVKIAGEIAKQEENSQNKEAKK